MIIFTMDAMTRNYNEMIYNVMIRQQYIDMII